ncbi:hypothetical protein [uncultured Winogradskyella sp.]|uniref:hypothetical protein n=1 Tax=uncultured Winogradskyella sp. TaxID=395353 RepID=UPI00261AFCD9|nr:hypothetical protein [uncultured Winogradskyella sp.]
MKSHYSTLSLYFILCISFSFLNAQEESDLINIFDDYIDAPRELVYLHLNKSTYIKGESIGFTAYVLDKKTKKTSLLTTNLYVSVEDENKNIIKKKLIRIDNGVASNIFTIDSLFSSGYYNIKAYTNWMRNFEEQNYFIESIRVIDPEKERVIVNEIAKNNIDAQFLPEGGHLIHGVINKIGVVIKDVKGYGLPSADGTVTDQNNDLITTFKVNKLGIGNFPLLAELGKQYKVKISHLNKDYLFPINHKIEEIGVSISVANHKNRAVVALKTNLESIALINDKKYTLSLHNGAEIKTFDVSFKNNPELIKSFDLATLPAGINVITLFNENNKPIAERLFFNFNGLDIIKSEEISVSKIKDSLSFKLNFNKIDKETFNNLSISILPKGTQSHKRHHNILSYTFLQPYLNGNIEQARYYFTDITDRKKLELDNLLLTQGWSSYEWDNIFKSKTNLPFEFEQGIKLKVNTNEDNATLETTYMIYSKDKKEPFFFEIEKTDLDYFYIDNFFPLESDGIYLSKFEKENIFPTKLYIQAMPNRIPYLNTSHNILKPKMYYSLQTHLSTDISSFKKLRDVQQLDEVVVNAEFSEKELRIAELKKKVRGDITIIDDKEIKHHMYLSNFLSVNGFKAFELEKESIMIVTNKFARNPPPLLYLDGFLADSRDLYRLNLKYIDYISIDRMSNMPNRYLGIIRIQLYPGSRTEDDRTKKQEFIFPLTFSTKKKFYVPKYQYYDDDFYIGFGTVDWKPELSIDNQNSIYFNIEQQEVPVTLFIEGIANDGSFIFEEKPITLN